MTRYAMAVLLVCGAFWSSAGELSRDHPKGVPDFHTWARKDDLPSEDVTDVAVGNASVSYRLYTMPKRQGVFEFTHYQVCPLGAGACDPEMLFWITYVPERNRLESSLFCRYRVRTWKKLWLGRTGKWYRMSNDSPEFKGEMPRIRKIYDLRGFVFGLYARYWEDAKELTF